MNNQRLKVTLAAAFLFAMAVDAQAKSKLNTEPYVPFQDVPVLMTPESFKAALKDAKQRAKRTVASNDSYYEKGFLSPQFRDLRNQVISGPSYDKDGQAGKVYPGLAIPQPPLPSDRAFPEFKAKLKAFDDFAKKIYTDDDYYNKLPADAKFAVAQMTPLYIFRGFVNRCQYLFQNAHFSHTAAVTALRALASGIYTYLPTDQWKAGMIYITYPQADWKFPIDDEAGLQRFIEAEAIPAVRKMADRLQNLEFDKDYVYFDNTILYGTSQFATEEDQYPRFGKAELRLARAGAWLALSGLHSLDSYQLNGLFKAMNEVGQDYGIGRTVFDVDLGNAKNRFAAFRKYNSSDQLFKYRGPNFDKAMIDSRNALINAFQQAQLAWGELGCLSADKKVDPDLCAKAGNTNYTDAQRNEARGRNIFDPAFAVAFDRVALASLKNLDYLVPNEPNDGRASKDGRFLQNAVVLNDNLSGANLDLFFTKPPQDLTVFFPLKDNGFQGGSYEVDTDVADPSPPAVRTVRNRVRGLIGGTAARPYHDYFFGAPIAWDTKQFTPYFGTVNTDQDVRHIARAAGQAWGGWLIGVPLGALMF